MGRAQRFPTTPQSQPDLMLAIELPDLTHTPILINPVGWDERSDSQQNPITARSHVGYCVVRPNPHTPIFMNPVG